MIKNRKIFSILKRYQDSREALVLTGFRRVGKTSVMRKIFEELATDNKIFLDLESPINQKIFQEENYDNIPKSFINLGINFQERAYVFLDEIQLIKNITSVIKYLYDHYNIKFYLTGSASFYLKNRFSESMAGRKFVFDLFPLDFEEFLWFKEQKINLGSLQKENEPLPEARLRGIPPTGGKSSILFASSPPPATGYSRNKNKKRQNELLSKLYEEYLFYGGFPGVVLQDSLEAKKQALDDILGSYFQLDVQTLSSFRDNQNLKDLLFLLTPRVGQKIDVSKMAVSLNVSRQTVYQYLDFFEQTYLIDFLRPLSGSRDVQLRHIPKIYFVDSGLLNHLGQIGQGQLFENKIFNQLKTSLAYNTAKTLALNDNLNYYQTKTGIEIDFVVKAKTGYEAKIDGNVFDLKKLDYAAQKAGLNKAYVVSLTKKETGERIISPYFLG